VRAAEPLDQPQLDELEVSVFGRCRRVHRCPRWGATWLIVDSHRVGETSPPVALEYLAAIGVPSEVVALVAATHWDRDHIAGLSEVVEECTEADFMCTGAIHDPEFFQTARPGRAT
jgi:glyoxylase-like metal-dependent hydrolase (beta-lactamase superfamily II)